MSATTRYAVRAVFVGVVGAATSLQANLPGVSTDDAIQAVIAGIVALGVYAGVGAVTPLEPAVGKKTST